jgi:hypothetical protein
VISWRALYMELESEKKHLKLIGKRCKIMEEIVYYLDFLITTINPGLNASFSDYHPYQKQSEELNDDM